MKRRSESKSPTQIRCAIYTRKSTEEGLEQEFNSLDAQRDSAENFIASQKHAGWVCVQERYDDGGYTGGNMVRRQLRPYVPHSSCFTGTRYGILAVQANSTPPGTSSSLHDQYAEGGEGRRISCPPVN